MRMSWILVEKKKKKQHLLGRPAVESKRNTTIQESRPPRARSRSPPSSRSLLASTASSQDLNALLCFVFYPLSLSGSLSGCQCWDPLLGRARGKNKEKRRHLRAFLQRAPRTNPILHEVLGARPTLSKKLLSYFQRSTRWDMEKYCTSRVFQRLGGLKNDVSHFFTFLFFVFH